MLIDFSFSTKFRSKALIDPVGQSQHLTRFISSSVFSFFLPFVEHSPETSSPACSAACPPWLLAPLLCPRMETLHPSPSSRRPPLQSPRRISPDGTQRLIASRHHRAL